MYSARPTWQAIITDQTYLLHDMFTRITPAMCKVLDAPMTLTELTKALTEMARNKAPGPDGIVTQFYQTL
jgi:hypothetical protein